jgi:RNA polymerase sigma factor (TIGR02999 family)
MTPPDESNDSLADVTLWLQKATDGDLEARDRAYKLVSNRLRDIVRTRMSSKERIDLTLTEVVDDAYLKLINLQNVQWQDRLHFLRFACSIIRQLLIDKARERLRKKRNSGVAPVALDNVSELTLARTPEALIALSEAMDRLNEDYPDLAAVVELRYFGGWTLEQIANEILNAPLISVRRQWEKARTLLHSWLTIDGDL